MGSIRGRNLELRHRRRRRRRRRRMSSSVRDPLQLRRRRIRMGRRRGPLRSSTGWDGAGCCRGRRRGPLRSSLGQRVSQHRSRSRPILRLSMARLRHRWKRIGLSRRLRRNLDRDLHADHLRDLRAPSVPAHIGKVREERRRLRRHDHGHVRIHAQDVQAAEIRGYRFGRRRRGRRRRGRRGWCGSRMRPRGELIRFLPRGLVEAAGVVPSRPVAPLSIRPVSGAGALLLWVPAIP